MKKIFLLAVSFLFALIASSQNWKPLFNGKDLTGWKQLNGKAKFAVDKGELVGRTVFGEPNSFLATEKNYGDFVLEFEFKVDSTMNSGVQFRSESKPDYKNGRVHGYQFEMDPSKRAWTGGIYDEARRDWLYTMDLNAPAKNSFKQGQWNKAKIECIGNNLRTWVNGVPCAYVVDAMTPKGFIALQVHAVNKKEDEGKEVRWRNLRIQTENLKSSPYHNIFVVNLIANTLSEAEENNGVGFLWDGKTTNGWRGAYKDKFPDKGWTIKDGTLNVLASTGAESTNGGDIVTTKEYSAFILQFEFRLTDSANSGVKYFVTEKEHNSGSAIGLEYQMLDDDKHPDGKKPSTSAGSLFDLIAPENKTLKPVGEYNKARVVINNGHVEHWLNGNKILEYDLGSASFKELVAKSKFKGFPRFALNSEGFIALQYHGDDVWYRKIRIRAL